MAREVLWARRLLARPGWVLVGLAVMTAAMAALLPRLRISSDLRSMVPPQDPALVQLRQATDEFGSQDVLMVVLENPEGVGVATLQKAWRLARELERIEGVESVRSPLDVELVEASPDGIVVEPAASEPPSTPEQVRRLLDRVQRSPLARSLVSPDGKAIALLVTLERGVAFEDAFARRVAPQLEAAVARQRGPERIEIAGEPYIGYAITRSIRRDMAVLFPLAVAVVLASLYGTFRTPAALVLPMVPVLLSLVWTLGCMAALGVRLTIISAALPVMLVVVGSASAIHILNRYGELRRQGVAHADAVAQAMASLAAPLVMVSLTDAAGFASLVTSFVQPVREFGAFTALAVLFSLVASLLAVPAVLMLRPPRGGLVGEETAPTREPQGWESRLAGWCAELARRHGLMVVAAAVAVAGALAAGSSRVRVETNLLEYFGPRSPVVQGTRQVERLFGGTQLLSIVVDTGRPDGAKDPELLRRVRRLQDALEQQPHIADTQSLVDVVEQVHRALAGEPPQGGRPQQPDLPGSPEAVAQELLLFSLQGGSGLDALVNYDYSKLRIVARVANLSTVEIRELVQRMEHQAAAAFQGLPVKVAVVGVPRIVVRLQEQFVPGQLKSMALAFAVVWLIVSALMRSWSVGTLAMVPLVLTVAMQFGLMGYSGIPLDIATTMIAGITIGVGVDYAIHLLSRYLREQAAHADPVRALHATLASTGRAIAVNAVTLGAGFAVLIFSDFRAVAVLGELLALTMMVSAVATLVVLAALLVRLPHRRPVAVEGAGR